MIVNLVRYGNLTYSIGSGLNVININAHAAFGKHQIRRMWCCFDVIGEIDTIEKESRPELDKSDGLS